MSNKPSPMYPECGKEIDMDGDLISRKALLKKTETIYYVVDDALTTASVVKRIDIVMAPAVDTIPRVEYEQLLKRLRHLLESDFISSFDEVDITTGRYKRDIDEADKVQPVRHSKWVCRTPGMFSCNACRNLAVENQSMYYCPGCEAKMDGEAKDDG